ncbi:MAG: hypothetical protein JWQ38_2508 [Flavipsychrobacter sp.]|nr:hypothetical protein [Flavipsychrobacter sp.]
MYFYPWYKCGAPLFERILILLKYRFSLIIVIVFCKQYCFAQVEPNVEQISRTSINYRSFVTTNSTLFAINDSGAIVVWDLTKPDIIAIIHPDTSFRYTAICTGKSGEVFAGTNTGNIYKVHASGHSVSLFLKAGYHITAMCFNAQNKLFLTVPYAVYQPVEKKRWTKFTNHSPGFHYRKRIFGLFFRKMDAFFTVPQFTYLDKGGRWWMYSRFGEFGSEIEIFDTKKERILSNRYDSIGINSLYVQSIFDDNSGNTYITSGLQHFDNTGEIYRIAPDRMVTKIFNGMIPADTIISPKSKGQLFVGPGTYNSIDNCIYFASSNGFYKVNLTTDGKFGTPRRLFNPKLNWQNEPRAIGVAMNIMNVEFTTDNKLLFLSSSDGFGIYDSGKLVMFK